MLGEVTSRASSAALRRRRPAITFCVAPASRTHLQLTATDESTPNTFAYLPMNRGADAVLKQEVSVMGPNGSATLTEDELVAELQGRGYAG